MSRFATVLVCTSSILAVAIQKHSSRRGAASFTEVYLADDVVKETGSYCINGDTPKYYLREGSEKGKWFFWFGQSPPCSDDAACEDQATHEDDGEGTSQDFEQFNTIGQVPMMNHEDFENYNAVYIRNCDYGLFLGNRTGVYTASSGRKMYFRGARILANIVADLQLTHTFEEVLLGGASGGANSAFVGAENLKNLLGDSLTKFGVVGINGYFSDMKSANFSNFAKLQGVTTVSPSCSDISCLDPAVAYSVAGIPTFVVQLFDKSVMNSDYADSNSDFEPAWEACLHCKDSTSTETCTDTMVETLKPFWHEFWNNFTSYSHLQDFGGLFSSCACHHFWRVDDAFNSQETDGSTVGDAASKWWSSIGTSSDSSENWYWPCKLGDAPDPQCESTCYIDDECPA